MRVTATDLGALRRGGELCPVEAMLMGAGEPESWVMDWAPPLGAELWSLEEIEAAFTEPSLTASSLGS